MKDKAYVKHAKAAFLLKSSYYGMFNCVDSPHAIKRKIWNLNKLKILYEEGLYLTSLKIEYVFSMTKTMAIRLASNCLTYQFVNKLIADEYS